MVGWALALLCARCSCSSSEFLAAHFSMPITLSRALPSSLNDLVGWATVGCTFGSGDTNDPYGLIEMVQTIYCYYYTAHSTT